MHNKEEKTIDLTPLAVSVADAARLIGVSKPTIYQCLRQQDFPAFRVGGRVLISVEGLCEWVRRQTPAMTREGDV